MHSPILPRVVLDTNTVIALWHFHDGTLAVLANAIQKKHIQLLSRGDALKELRLVLAYQQFRLPAETQQTLIETYHRDLLHICCTDTTNTTLLPVCRDPDDQKFLEIARHGEADYLLTRDKTLLKLARHRQIRSHFIIMTPEMFCKTFPATRHPVP